MYHTLCILLASPAVYPIAIQSELPEPGHEGEDSSREGGQQVGVEIPPESDSLLRLLLNIRHFP